MKEPQLQLRPVATDELASTLSLSKRVTFALQKNESSGMSPQLSSV